MRDPSGVGAVAASSHHLGEAVCRATHVPEADVVVEYGPGTGTITDVILD